MTPSPPSPRPKIPWAALCGAMVAAAALLAAAPASAVEVEFDGWYRARMRAYDTLSLDRARADSEGLSWYAQHRLWLKPKFLITDDVSAFVEIRALDGVVWGDQPFTYTNPVQGLLSYDERAVTAPTSTTDPTDALRDITLWRAWGEAQTPIGTFSFGRMPLQWGQGIWLNDGLCDTCDWGDTSDRIRWEYLVQDQIWVSAAANVNTEGFVNETDDTTAFDLSFAYRTEQFESGLWATWTRTPSDSFDLVTLDAAVSAELGRISAGAEVVGQFGGGDLGDDVSDVSIMTVGAVLHAGLDASPWKLEVEGGYASGDGDVNDSRLRVHTFDRDHSVGIILFEQPMPILAEGTPNDANGGRNTDFALTGEAVSNALYAKPTFGREIYGGLSLEQSILGARVAKVPDSFGSRRSYGLEFDTSVVYRGVEHFEAGATFGAFLPGTYYRDYQSPDGALGVEDNFDDPVFAGQLQLKVEF